MCGIVALGALAACKSEGAVAPPFTGDGIPNPRGPLALGDVISLNVNADSACSHPVYHGSRVVAVGIHAVILSDTLNPVGGFTTADFQRYAARFDTLVYPVDVANFGEPTDIDKNGHVAILFTRAVNELTPPRANSYVGGFAYSRDLFPTTKTARAQACAGSNEGEYFYVLAPDPYGTINSNARSTGFVDSATTAVLAHEFQHLINSSRRLYVNNTAAFEEKWLDEGLAHEAEELLYYRESGLAPRSNLDLAAIRATSTQRSAYNSSMSGNGSRYKSYLAAPSTNSPYSLNDSLPTRGAAWSFLRYAVDRVNATDGFASGPGQVTIGAGDVTLSPGVAGGEYSLTVVNTSLQGGSTTSYSLRTASPVATVAVESMVPTATPASMLPVSAGLQRDARFESALRDRERAALMPLMGTARRWYATQLLPAPSALRSRLSLSTSAAADADAALWFKLVNNSSVGVTNLQSVVGDLAPLLRDWSVSHAVDDVAAPSTQYQQRSWNWHSIFPGLTVPSTGYPLLVTTLSSNTNVTGASVLAGGAAFYRVVVPASGTVTVTLGSVGTSNPNLQLVSVRTK
ncbi:hypothetical protein BH11GEM1_BH11GEM1_18260 [soil metagenome]